MNTHAENKPSADVPHGTVSQKVPIDALKGASETLLIMLSAKAEEAARPDGMFRDSKVLEIYEKLGGDISQLAAGSLTQVGICIRTVIIDEWVSEFLEQYPQGTVVNLGAGLDTRLTRIDNGQVRWFDLDFPETIAVRRHFFEENDRLHMLAYSATDPAWLEEIGPAEHVLIIAEGLCMFFTEQEMRDMVKMLADRFPTGNLIYDAITPEMIKRAPKFESFRKTSGQWRWGIRTGKMLVEWDPRLQFIREESLFERQRHRWPWWMRFITAYMPRVTRAVRQHVTQLKFQPTT